MQILTRALLFDMDGTAINSNPVVEAMWQRFCEPRGIDLKELLKFSHGRLAKATLKKYMPEATEEELLHQEHELLQWERTANEGVSPIPGVPEVLARVEQLGIPWALVTSAVEILARTRFQITGLPWPKVAVTAERVELGKPDPACYLAAAKELRIPASQCLVFEDAGPGVAAGLAAGAQVVVVGHDYSEPTRGLPRIEDFHHVRVNPATRQGWFEIDV